MLNGGTGIDTADYSNLVIGATTYLGATAGVIVNLNLTGAQNTAGAGTDTLVGIENLTGSNFNDTLKGELGDANGTINGGAGNDRLATNYSFNFTLNGDNGNDVLSGHGTGTLNGGDGDERLTADDGNNYRLNGGAGNDYLGVDTSYGSGSRMNGGTVADTLEHTGSDLEGSEILTFDYNSVSESPAGAGKDTIIGFTGSKYGGDQAGDQIDLTDIDANSLLSGNQAFAYIGGSAFTAAGLLRYNTTAGLLQGSTDGDTAAEFEIQLLGAPALVVGGVGTDILL